MSKALAAISNLIGRKEESLTIRGKESGGSVRFEIVEQTKPPISARKFMAVVCPDGDRPKLVTSASLAELINDLNTEIHEYDDLDIVCLYGDLITPLRDSGGQLVGLRLPDGEEAVIEFCEVDESNQSPILSLGDTYTGVFGGRMEDPDDIDEDDIDEDDDGFLDGDDEDDDDDGYLTSSVDDDDPIDEEDLEGFCA